MAFGGFYSFNHKHSISFGTRFYREPKLSPDDEDYPFIPKDENNNPIVGIEAFRPLSVSADLAYSYRIGRYLGLSVTARYIRSSYGELFTNNALGFDVAAYARIPLNRMLEGAWVSAGAKISDFGFTFDDSNYDLPTNSVSAVRSSPRSGIPIRSKLRSIWATATLPRRTSPSGWASAWSMC